MREPDEELTEVELEQEPTEAGHRALRVAIAEQDRRARRWRLAFWIVLILWILNS